MKNFYIKGYNNVKYLSEINVNTFKPMRGGVIPCVIKDGQLYFCFGIDSKYKEITDLAGGISYKKDKNFINGCLREFEEETLGVFGKITTSQMNKSIVICSNNNSSCAIILPLQVKMNDITNKFLDKSKKTKHNLEVENLIWISYKEVKDMFRSYTCNFYHRTKTIISKTNNLDQYLEKLHI